MRLAVLCSRASMKGRPRGNDDLALGDADRQILNRPR
jgi:hypothetical protein